MNSTGEQNYDYPKDKGTGKDTENYKIINYRFDRYELKIKLTVANEFIEILEIKINKEFLSQKQKIISQGYIDINEDYPE